MRPCCEEAHNLTLHLETIATKVKKLRDDADKLYERAKYYGEELSQHQLWEITQELKKLTVLAESESRR